MVPSTDPDFTTTEVAPRVAAAIRTLDAGACLIDRAAGRLAGLALNGELAA
jgi:hypothetical protein